EIAKLLQGFEVKIIACRRDPSKTTNTQKELVNKVLSQNALEYFLKQIDILISSLPLTDATKGFLSQKEFDLMKDGIVIVNVGRGNTIDEEAFYQAIKNKKIYAAGLDPQWNYPSRSSNGNEKEKNQKRDYPSNYPIHEFDNVVLSPHRAADLKQGYARAHWEDVIENIMRIYKGEEPLNLIDLEKGY
ncbi:MAG: hypothetical protein EU542_08065, partial [Promethearchaeota archaeon]